MSPLSSKIIFGAVVATALPLALATAEVRPGRRKPPQAAFDACATSTLGAPCSVTLGDHSMTGTCEKGPDDEALACRLDHPPGPPPEAIAACKDASEGATCSVTFDDHTVSGSCEKGPDSHSTLACRPAGGRPRR